MATKREQLEKLVHDMQALADNADAKGEFSSEDQERMVNLATTAKALKDQITAEAEVTGTLKDTKHFLAAMVGKPEEETAADRLKARSDETGIATPTGGKTLGELFVESPVYLDWHKHHVAVGSDNIPMTTKVAPSLPMPANFLGGSRKAMSLEDMKTLITGTSSTSGGAFVMNDRYGALTDLIGQRELTVRDLCTKLTTQSDTVEYVRVTAKTNNASVVAEASAFTPSALGGSGLKPESALALEVVSTTVKTIAHWIPMTKRAAADAGQVRGLVDNFLLYGLREVEEDQLIGGSGTGENLTGILNSSPETVGSTGTDIDAIVDAIRKLRVTGRRHPNALVIHPNDWYSTSFLLAKTGDGTNSSANYLIGNPRAGLDQVNSLWGLNVVVSEAVTENTALVGEFRFAVIWDREQGSIQVSDNVNDQFIRNMLTILAEERLAFGVLDSQAFCTVTSV